MLTVWLPQNDQRERLVPRKEGEILLNRYWTITRRPSAIGQFQDYGEIRLDPVRWVLDSRRRLPSRYGWQTSRYQSPEWESLRSRNSHAVYALVSNQENFCIIHSRLWQNCPYPQLPRSNECWLDRHLHRWFGFWFHSRRLTHGYCREYIHEASLACIHQVFWRLSNSLSIVNSCWSIKVHRLVHACNYQ